jgi:hypothetical protein
MTMNGNAPLRSNIKHPLPFHEVERLLPALVGRVQRQKNQGQAGVAFHGRQGPQKLEGSFEHRDLLRSG